MDETTWTTKQASDSQRVFDSFSIFMSITQGMTEEQRNKVVRVASATGLVLLIVFAVFGVQFLYLFNIPLSSFRIAGGILLLLISFRILM